MIDWVIGKICEKEATRLVLEKGGIAFSINIPLSTYEALGDIEDEEKIFIHLSFSHEKLELFGFKSLEERNFFRDLLIVQGIGPRTALRIISGTDFIEFKRAIANEDIETISFIKGISQKRASKLIFELKEKYAKEEFPDESLESNTIRALIGLGIPERKARELVRKVKAATLEDMIKEALKRL